MRIIDLVVCSPLLEGTDVVLESVIRVSGPRRSGSGSESWGISVSFVGRVVASDDHLRSFSVRIVEHEHSGIVFKSIRSSGNHEFDGDFRKSRVWDSKRKI